VRITKLIAKNVAGSSFDHDLWPITLFAGEVDSGKTTRVNTLTLALANRLPGVASTGSAIFNALATGSLMSVFVGTDDSRSIMREWREEKGKVKYQGRMNGFPEDFTIDPVAIDPMEYMALSAVERNRFLFARSSGAPTIEKLVASITANLKNIKLEENTPDTEGVINRLVAFVTRFGTKQIEDQAGFEVLNVRISGQSSQEWLAALYEAVKDDVALAKANVDRQEKTLQGLTQNQSASPAPVDAEQRMATARQELEKANGEVIRLTEIGKGLARQLAEQKVIADSWKGAPAEDYDTPLKTEKSDIEAWLANEDVERPEVSATAASNKLATIRTEMSGIQSALDSTMKEITEFDSLECCPTCKAKAKGWKKTVLETLQRQAIEHQSKIDKLKDTFLLAKADLEKAEAKVLAELNVRKTIREKRTRLGIINAELKSFEDQNAKAEPARLAREKIAELATKIEQAREDYKAAAKTADEKKQSVTDCETAYKQLVKERGEAASRATAQAEAAKYKAEHTILKQFVVLLNDLQALLTEQAVGPILETCNRLCSGILRSPLVMREGEIGMMREGNFVTKTLGGGHKLLTYAAVSLALAVNAPLKLVILDELGKLDRRRKSLLMANVLALVEAGHVDQVLLCEPNPDDYEQFAKDHPKLFGIVRL